MNWIKLSEIKPVAPGKFLVGWSGVDQGWSIGLNAASSAGSLIFYTTNSPVTNQ